VNTLSCRPNHTQGKNDNKNQTLLKEEWFRSIITQENKLWKEVEKAEEFIEEEVKGVVEQQEER